jgi:hypothetical protein
MAADHYMLLNEALEFESAADKNSTQTKDAGATRRRHGAKNQHKAKYFVRWLLDTFGDVKTVVDVAGGKGEIAARLCLCHGMKVTMIDPRQADIESVFMNIVAPKLPNKWQNRLRDRQSTEPSFVQDTIEERFRQFIMYFTETTVQTFELSSVIQECDLLIGMHADSATECIADVALKHNKPFVIVPCCVFPNLFQKRYLTKEGNKVPVRSYEQFCEYLLQKDSRFHMTELPFEGRNIAIWWDGKA